jgi:hypothetical protein
VNPASADVDQLPGRGMRMAVERFPDGLIAAADGAKRVQSQERIYDPQPSAAAQMATNADERSSEKREEQRRPDPPEGVNNHAARREDEESGAGQPHEAGRRERPTLWLVGPSHRERREQRPTRREREQDGAGNHVFLRSREWTEHEGQRNDDSASQATRDNPADAT